MSSKNREELYERVSQRHGRGLYYQCSPDQLSLEMHRLRLSDVRRAIEAFTESVCVSLPTKQLIQRAVLPSIKFQKELQKAHETLAFYYCDFELKRLVKNARQDDDPLQELAVEIWLSLSRGEFDQIDADLKRSITDEYGLYIGSRLDSVLETLLDLLVEPFEVPWTTAFPTTEHFYDAIDELEIKGFSKSSLDRSLRKKELKRRPELGGFEFRFNNEEKQKKILEIIRELDT